MTGVAILGYGVVGSGTARLLTNGSEGIVRRTGVSPVLKRIVDIRPFPGDPFSDLITSQFEDVLLDPEIRVVVETIGGIGAAYQFTRQALASGRHVVTSNKELVAEHGPELLALAENHRVHYLFEASVGGGIPVLHPLNHCLHANEIHSVAGILNGTTNYILTRMEQAGIPFSDALSEAQSNGFAEQSPTADIEGWDSVRKLAILSSIAYERFIPWREIQVEGVTGVRPEQIGLATRAGAHVRLLARSARQADGRLSASVLPVALSRAHPVCSAAGVNNAVAITGDAVGTVMFYGPGAGALPTASAVVSDVLECLLTPNQSKRAKWQPLSGGALTPFAVHEVQVLVKKGHALAAALEANGYTARHADVNADVLWFGSERTLREGHLSLALERTGMPHDAGWIRYVPG